MRFRPKQPTFWPFRSGAPEAAVVRDAEELIATWGESAFEQAAIRSWREDTGLLATARPGHWARVRREFGHRLGRLDDDPEADFGIAHPAFPFR